MYQDGKLIDCLYRKMQERLKVILKVVIHWVKEWFNQSRGVLSKARSCMPMAIPSPNPPSSALYLWASQNRIDCAVCFSKSAIFVNWLDNVEKQISALWARRKGRLAEHSRTVWSNGALTVMDVEQDSDDFFVNYTGFLEPSSLYTVNAKP